MSNESGMAIGKEPNPDIVPDSVSSRLDATIQNKIEGPIVEANVHRVVIPELNVEGTRLSFQEIRDILGFSQNEVVDYTEKLFEEEFGRFENNPTVDMIEQTLFVVVSVPRSDKKVIFPFVLSSIKFRSDGWWNGSDVKEFLERADLLDNLLDGKTVSNETVRLAHIDGEWRLHYGSLAGRNFVTEKQLDQKMSKTMYPYEYRPRVLIPYLSVFTVLGGIGLFIVVVSLVASGDLMSAATFIIGSIICFLSQLFIVNNAVGLSLLEAIERRVN